MDSSNVFVGSIQMSEPKDISEIKNKRIVVEKAAITSKMAYKYTNSVAEYKDTEAALHAVVDGKSDVALVDKYTAAFFIANGHSKDLKILNIK